MVRFDLPWFITNWVKLSQNPSSTAVTGFQTHDPLPKRLRRPLDDVDMHEAVRVDRQRLCRQ